VTVPQGGDSAESFSICAQVLENQLRIVEKQEMTTNASDPMTDYMQVRRVICRVSLGNNHLSPQERLVLASSVGGASGLSQKQIQVLIEDASSMPDIAQLMSEIHLPAQYRQLMVDLSALAVVKGDWDDTEVAAVGEVIGAFPFDEEIKTDLETAFDTLKKASHQLG
jgi:hypothetical protein